LELQTYSIVELSLCREVKYLLTGCQKGLTVNDFFQAVYEIVAKIPEGRVITYGQIADRLNKPFAARAVGDAMRYAPADLELPCHRVVNQKGEMAPEHVFGGKAKQRALLESEGVVFLPEGRIDMQKCLWQMDEWEV
jgi:methylated-DNA-protein-cysteine methyltransferase related protein